MQLVSNYDHNHRIAKDCALSSLLARRSFRYVTGGLIQGAKYGAIYGAAIGVWFYVVGALYGVVIGAIAGAIAGIFIGLLQLLSIIAVSASSWMQTKTLAQYRTAIRMVSVVVSIFAGLFIIPILCIWRFQQSGNGFWVALVYDMLVAAIPTLIATYAFSKITDEILDDCIQRSLETAHAR